MTRPDLSNPAQRRAYRAELRRVYWPWRLASLALLIIAMFGSMLDPSRDKLWGTLLIVGAVLVIGVIIARTRYHQRRMREDHQV
jgi:preprotein translocase subunit SecE